LTEPYLTEAWLARGDCLDFAAGLVASGTP